MNNELMKEFLITYEQAGELVNRKRGTIQKWVRSGKIDKILIDKNKYVNKNQVLAYYNSIAGSVTFPELTEEIDKLPKQICTMCHELLPCHSGWFNKSKSANNGLQKICRVCNSNYCKIWNQERPDYAKEHYQQNHWETKISTHNSQARALGLTADLTIEQWYEILEYFNYCCAYCGDIDDLQVEHYISKTKGGGCTYKNIVPACRHCNIAKEKMDWVLNPSDKLKLHLGILL